MEPFGSHPSAPEVLEDIKALMTNSKWSSAACLAILFNEPVERNANLRLIKVAVTVEAGEPFVKKDMRYRRRRTFQCLIAFANICYSS